MTAGGYRTHPYLFHLVAPESHMPHREEQGPPAPPTPPPPPLRPRSLSSRCSVQESACLCGVHIQYWGSPAAAYLLLFQQLECHSDWWPGPGKLQILSTVIPPSWGQLTSPRDPEPEELKTPGAVLFIQVLTPILFCFFSSFLWCFWVVLFYTLSRLCSVISGVISLRGAAVP